MAVDLTSFDTFRKTATFQFGQRVSDLLSRGLPTFIGDADQDGLFEFALGADEFEIPTNDRYAAAAYALYRRKCRKAGVPVGPFDI